MIWVLMEKQQFLASEWNCPISGPISVVLFNFFSTKMERDVAFILLLDETAIKT